MTRAIKFAAGGEALPTNTDKAYKVRDINPVSSWERLPVPWKLEKEILVEKRGEKDEPSNLFYILYLACYPGCCRILVPGRCPTDQGWIFTSVIDGLRQT
jgi:hypothetical protein